MFDSFSVNIDDILNNRHGKINNKASGYWELFTKSQNVKPSGAYSGRYNPLLRHPDKRYDF